jgi:plasmid stabilization system protein ParE
MDVEIIWTKRAENGYDNIINYLEKEWSEREIRNFIAETRQFLELLKTNPRMLFLPQRTRREEHGEHKEIKFHPEASGPNRLFET